MMSYSSNWFTLLLLFTSALLVLCCDPFNRGSIKVKHEPVNLVIEDYIVSLCQRIHLLSVEQCHTPYLTSVTSKRDKYK